MISDFSVKEKSYVVTSRNLRINHFWSLIKTLCVVAIKIELVIIDSKEEIKFSFRCVYEGIN